LKRNTEWRRWDAQATVLKMQKNKATKHQIGEDENIFFRRMHSLIF
jgi:hypothetical protein